MNSKNVGFFVRFDESRHSDLIKNIDLDLYGEFSDALMVNDWPVGSLCVTVISFSTQSIDYIGLAKKGKKVVTSKNRIDFYSLVNLKRISLSLIKSKLELAQDKQFSRVVKNGIGFVEQTVWDKVINVLKEERPESAEELIVFYRYKNTLAIAYMVGLRIFFSRNVMR